MADKSKGIPAWQQAQSQPQPSDDGTNPSETTSDSKPEQPTLEQARQFLDDPSVQGSSTEKKTEFLKSKGFSDTQVHELLSDTPNPESPVSPEEERLPSQEPPQSVSGSQEADSSVAPPASVAPTSEGPPIITYPEFLTKSPRPPPLITPSRLLNILSVSGGLWTLLYGTARYVVNPMAESLNDSRGDYYAHVNEKLTELVGKLEDAASEVPYKNGKILVRSEVPEDNESTASDPTEMFHRDIGTQTSPQTFASSLSGGDKTSSASDKPVDAQARRLAAIRSSLRELSDTYIKRAENTEQLTSQVREAREEVERLAYPPLPDYTSIHGAGYGRLPEPDDEFKRTKDAIRSAKGMFLSTRSFPTVLGPSAAAPTRT